MTVKDIIETMAIQTGRDDIVQTLKDPDNANEEGLQTIEKLVKLCNLVINELATGFIPMCITDSITAENGKISFERLSHNPYEILAVYDDNGVDVLGKVFSKFITVLTDKVNVEYSCFPPEYSLEDEVGYDETQVSKRVLSYGLCAEFAICEGCFKDAVMWHDRYADAVYKICKPTNKTTRKRAWL